MTLAHSWQEVADIAASFETEGGVHSGSVYGSGHINETWVITAGIAGNGRRYLLQRLNERVFSNPQLVVQNCANILEHLASQGPQHLVGVRSRAADWLVRDATGGVWRMFNFIEGTASRSHAANPDDAYRVGRAFGEFLRRMSSYRGPPIRDTIPGFHDTAARLRAFDVACATGDAARIKTARGEITRASRYRALASVLGEARLPSRLVHNDAKIANVLFDAASGEVLCVVDLDTVMQGLSLHDFGDMARTMATDGFEDAPNAGGTQLDAGKFSALSRGYIDGAGGLLTAHEIALFATAAQVIAWEQSLRFLTDYIEGDRYYRVAHAEQNLSRAAAQLDILEALRGAESLSFGA